MAANRGLGRLVDQNAKPALACLCMQLDRLGQDLVGLDYILAVKEVACQAAYPCDLESLP